METCTGGLSKSSPHLFGRYYFAVSAGLLFLIAPGRADAGIINARSVSFADVSAAVASALPGDTVVIPAGTATWTSGLVLTKAITLQGSTTISGDHTTTTMTANDRTIILDSVTRGGLSPVIFVNGITADTRIKGITFRGSALGGDGGAIMASYMPPGRLQISNCHFDQVHNKCFDSINGQCYGVMDHCLLDIDGTNESLYFTMANWGGNGYGGAWAAPTDFGGPTFFFVEDVTVNNALGAAQTVGATDGNAGAKFVVRYSTWKNCVVTDHGIESGYMQSTRAKEVYNNKFIFDRISGSGGLMRGGTALFHHNQYIYTSPGFTTGVTLQAYRSFTNGDYQAANGASAWDLNSDTADHTGNGIGGGPNGLIASGTYSGPDVTSSRASNLTIVTGAWAANQFAPASGHQGDYMITNTSVPSGIGWIVSNTSNSITFYNVGQTDPNASPLGGCYFRSGDHYLIFKTPTAGIQQPGRGQGDLLPTGAGQTARWLNQALDPVYSWNNTINGSNVNIGSSTPTIIEGRDFFNNTAKPGYTPYPYPHPLVNGNNQVAAPANLRIVGP